jgi:hypothetical protein
LPDDEVRRALFANGIDPDTPENVSTLTSLMMLFRDDKVMLNLHTFNGYKNIRSRVPNSAEILRDLVGNPFHPTTFKPAWRTEHTVGIASKMYEDRGFAAMPILADALEEAGCDSPDVLAHCRNPGVHVRGCWVIDHVLGKE